MRHININTLWIQEVQDREGVEFNKVLGANNPADLMAKYLSKETIDKHLNTLGQEMREGRAEKGLEMQGSSQVSPSQVTVRVARVSHHRPTTQDTSQAQELVPKMLGPQDSAVRREMSELVTSQLTSSGPRMTESGGRSVVLPHPKIEG